MRKEKRRLEDEHTKLRRLVAQFALEEVARSQRAAYRRLHALLRREERTGDSQARLPQRPHSSLDYRTPSAFFEPAKPKSAREHAACVSDLRLLPHDEIDYAALDSGVLLKLATQ